MDAQWFLDRLSGVRRSGNGWSAKCPAHEDQHSSLSVSLDDSGSRLLAYCHASCDTEMVLNELGLTWDQMFDNPLDFEGEFGYRDAHGRLLCVVERKAPKRFRQRRPGPAPGEWIWDVKEVERVLYRLPQVLAAKTANRWIFLVEGEKDVHTLEREGFVATTVMGGSAAWRPPCAVPLTEAKVCVIPDNDEPGRKFAEAALADLKLVARDLRHVVLDVPDKGDVTDWLLNGGTPMRLKDLVLAEPNQASSGPGLNGTRPILALSEVERQDVRWLWKGRLPAGKLTVLGGMQGAGKSHLSVAVAAALSRRDPPVGTLIVSFEDDPADTIRPRLEANGGDVSKVFLWDARSHGFAVKPHVRHLRDFILEHPEVELLIIDPLPSAIAAEADVYRETDVRGALRPLLGLGVAVLGIMHLAKSYDVDNVLHRFLGSTAFTALARSVLLLRNNQLTVVKSNLGAPAGPVAVRMESGAIHLSDPV